MIMTMTGHLRFVSKALGYDRGREHELAIRRLHAITPAREGVLDTGDLPNDVLLPQQTVKHNICDPPPHTPPHRSLYGRHLGYCREDVDKRKKVIQVTRSRSGETFGGHVRPN